VSDSKAIDAKTNVNLDAAASEVKRVVVPIRFLFHLDFSPQAPDLVNSHRRFLRGLDIDELLPLFLACIVSAVT
jgi:hypothetical protein